MLWSLFSVDFEVMAISVVLWSFFANIIGMKLKSEVKPTTN
jgi:hypothetical protein